MDESDFKEIANHLQASLDMAGLSSISSPLIYAEECYGSITPYQDLTIAMLKALDRHLSLLDARTYERALNSLRNNITEGTIQGATVDVSFPAPLTVDLSDVYNLTNLRNHLHSFISDLLPPQAPTPQRIP